VSTSSSLKNNAVYIDGSTNSSSFPAVEIQPQLSQIALHASGEIATDTIMSASLFTGDNLTLT
jgi:hypothetical protein